MEAALHAQRGAAHAGQLVHQPEAGVVSGGLVFRAGIAEADDKLDHAFDCVIGARSCATGAKDTEKPAVGCRAKKNRRKGGGFFVARPAGRHRCGSSGSRLGSRRFASGFAAFGGFRHGASRLRDAGDGRVVVTVGDHGHALRQLQVGQVQGLAQLHRANVHFDELGQVGRQARHFQVIDDVVDQAMAQLHARSGFLVHEVQGHLDVDLVVGRHALEVDVQHQRLERVHLECAQQGLFALAGHFQVQDRRVERFLLQGVPQGVVIQFDHLRLGGAAVDDAGGLARIAQAAARTRSLYATLESDNFHDDSKSKEGCPRPDSLVAARKTESAPIKLRLLRKTAANAAKL
ncbi:hypothetical protein CBM2594_A40103 [Cupriavidus taiwanensis]|uniref:Uncharacterized protein n=1 Tax=Cupriavidus taiwanensis TaxID=164546 RepID=A0A7Z7J7U3_9BURK|nr:hypothetical protein CBM2594_A40103 [Cupriavidus taiwanensis]